MRWPARAALRRTWGGLAAACANTPEDAEGLKSLGVDPSVIHVTGDPGIDSAAIRSAAADAHAPHLAPFHSSGRPTVVAGSTWPADEDVLARAWVGVGRVDPTALLLIAPHEPTRSHVDALLERLRGFGLAAVTLATVERRGSVDGVDAVVVDRVGVLAHLYTVGDVAYVGGGFGREGLHSVLEPAAAGLPTVFGPRHERSRSAGQLIETGGATGGRRCGIFAVRPTERGWSAQKKRVGLHSVGWTILAPTSEQLSARLICSSLSSGAAGLA